MFSIINNINSRLAEILPETGLPVHILSEDGMQTNHDISSSVILADISSVSDIEEKPGLRTCFSADLSIWLICRKTGKVDVNKILSNINDIILNTLKDRVFRYPPALKSIETVKKAPVLSSSDYNHFFIKKAIYKIEIEQSNRS